MMFHVIVMYLMLWHVHHFQHGGAACMHKSYHQYGGKGQENSGEKNLSLEEDECFITS